MPTTLTLSPLAAHLYDEIRAHGDGRTFAALLVSILDRKPTLGEPIDLRAADLELSEALTELGTAGLIQMDISAPRMVDRRALAVLADVDDVLDHAAWRWRQVEDATELARRELRTAARTGYEAGMSERAMSARLGVHRQTIRQALLADDVTTHRERDNARHDAMDRDDELAELLDD